MSGKLKALVVAVLLALTLAVSAPPPAAPSTVLAAECGTTGSG